MEGALSWPRVLLLLIFALLAASSPVKVDEAFTQGFKDLSLLSNATFPEEQRQSQVSISKADSLGHDAPAQPSLKKRVFGFQKADLPFPIFNEVVPSGTRIAFDRAIDSWQLQDTRKWTLPSKFFKTKLPEKKEIRIEEPIGQGSFGIIYKILAWKDGNLKYYAAKSARRRNATHHEVILLNYLRENLPENKKKNLMYIESLIIVYSRAAKEWLSEFIIMPYCNLGSLSRVQGSVADRLQELAFWFSSDGKKAVFKQMATGLRDLHSIGVVHLDIKPDNILLMSDSSESQIPNVKLADYGLARIADETNARDGTAFYMAPGKLCLSRSPCLQSCSLYWEAPKLNLLLWRRTT